MRRSKLNEESLCEIAEGVEANTAVKLLEGLNIDPHQDTWSSSESYRDIWCTALLQLLRKNTHLKELSFSDRRLNKPGRSPFEAEAVRKEIGGWIHLNKKGRRDLFADTITKERAVDLLIETKENTHCAFTMLTSKPELFF